MERDRSSTRAPKNKICHQTSVANGVVFARRTATGASSTDLCRSVEQQFGRDEQKTSLRCCDAHYGIDAVRWIAICSDRCCFCFSG